MLHRIFGSYESHARTGGTRPANIGRARRRIVAGLLALAGSGGAMAQDIYRWLDEHGTVNFSDSVPQRYRAVATRVEPRAALPTTDERLGAQARAWAEIRRAASDRSAATPMDRSPTPSAAPRHAAQVPDARTDCDTWRRLYRESEKCFAPYKTAKGATRAEAFDHCVQMAAPPSRCRAEMPR